MNSPLTLGRKEPDYSIDLNDLFETNMIEAEKEIMRRDYAEGKVKSKPTILFSMGYNQGKYRKASIYYLQQIGVLPGLELRNEFNRTYSFHRNVVKEYEKLRNEIGNAIKCKKLNPSFYKQYRISKICYDRYHRFFKGRWTEPSKKGKFLRCLSCGRCPKGGIMDFMCEKCKNNESEKFVNRGTWKTDILREDIEKASKRMESGEIGFFEAYNEVKRDFRLRIAPIRKEKRKAWERSYKKKKYHEMETIKEIENCENPN